MCIYEVLTVKSGQGASDAGLEAFQQVVVEPLRAELPAVDSLYNGSVVDGCLIVCTSRDLRLSYTVWNIGSDLEWQQKIWDGQVSCVAGNWDESA